MYKFALILLCFFLISCGGDGNGHHSPPPPPVCEFTYSEWGECQIDSTQSRTVISQQPEGCEGDPILSQSCIYVPPIIEPTDCCPKGDNILMCKKNYLTVSPYLTVQCNDNGYWYLTVRDAYTVVPLWIKLPLPDLSCCSIEKTGLMPEQCQNGCQILYAQPTDWILMSDMYGWYIRNNRTMEGYRVIQ